MNWKFDIVDLIVAVIISFILGCAVRPFLTSFSAGAGHPNPPASALQGFSSPSSEAPAVLLRKNEVVGADFNAGEAASHSAQNQHSLSGHLIRKVTAYCPCELCCGKWSDGYTASGHKIGKDDKFVAAPLSIPFGTKVVIPGYNNGIPVPVLDRGGAIKGNRLDVFFSTHQEALTWGRKWLNVRFWFRRFKNAI